MKTLEDLKHFYNTQLTADLRLLEQKRKSILNKMAVIGLVMMGLALVFIFVVLANEPANPVIIIAPLIVALIITGVIGSFLSKGYVIEFKMLVIDRLIKFLDENLSYNSRNYIPQSTFMMSEIFKTRPNRYKGDDFVSGKVGQTAIQFCELDAKHVSGSGKNRKVKTIFKGLFFIADFNKYFTCRTVVLPDTAEKLFGHFGQTLQSMNLGRDQLVKLEDSEFEKLFVVYSTDQIDARYILSTSLMQRIVDFKKRTGRDIHLSFIGSNIYVAIPYTKSLFEPRIFSTLLDFEPIAEYFDDLRQAIEIVDDLNLNTRIWTKQ